MKPGGKHTGGMMRILKALTRNAASFKNSRRLCLVLIEIKVPGILFGLLLLPLTSVSAQYCNPAVVDYIVRDQNGNVIGADELKTIHQQLPKTVGNADTAVGEVSFTSDGVTYYWPESVDWDKGKKVSTLEFANAGTCTLNLPRVDLT
jgi:hypothetical protein